MDRLNFFTVDLDYVHYLKAAELAHRGFTRVPNMEYGEAKKQKKEFSSEKIPVL